VTTSVELPEAFAFLWDNKADDGGPVRYRCSWGGRGGAKSHSFATALLLKGAERKMRIGCYREIQKSIKDSVKALLDDKIAAMGLGDFYQSLEYEIRGKNGTNFIFGGLRSGGKNTNLEGKKSTEGLDIAAVFEARNVSQVSLDILRPTVRTSGSEIWFEWNPVDPNDPIDQMFRGESGPPPGTIVRKVNWQDNPFFPDVLRRDMEWDRKRDFDKYQWVWEGEYERNGEARVFKNWRVEAFEAPPDAEFRFGADWGFAIDPTTLVRCYIEGRNLYIDYEAYMVGCEIDQTPQLFDSVPGSRRWLITADSARPETVSYMKRDGFKIVSAIKGPGSIEDGVEFLKSFDIIVHPRCEHTITELGAYKYKTDSLTGKVLPILADKDNNIIDAARYALEGARRADTETKRKAVHKPNLRPDVSFVSANGWMR
jgi:phage terminase large subunit